MNCDCMANMNERLAEHNTRLVPSFSFTFGDTKTWTTVSIQTEKIDTKKRGRPFAALATFCPFCGTKCIEDGGAA